MKIEGHHDFPVPRDEVWQAVLDPEVLAQVLPGMEGLEETGANRFEGAMVLKVGPVQGQFRGTVELSELQPPESYHLQLDGKGAPGFVRGEGSIRLEEVEEGTRLHYTVDAQVGGRIAAVGQRLLDSSTKVITRQALEGLERVIGQGAGEGEAEVTAPTQAELAADFAKGMADELVPRRHRPWIAAAVVGLVALAALVGIRACG